MTSATNVIGATFEDLADIIAQIDDKERVGVCLDTCHSFTAGYDLRTPEAFHETMDRFEKVIGLKYLKALHMNDSKAPFNSGRDLHANIGTGFLGLRAFHNIMNDPRLWGLPMVLETPIDVKDAKTGKEVQDNGIWAREIKLLESLVGLDAKSDEFKKLEIQLQAEGKAERDRVQAQADKKDTKARNKKAKAKAGSKGKKRKSKRAAETSSDEGSFDEENS
jgi:AP endonuclease-1